jgi:hypothetical protein
MGTGALARARQAFSCYAGLLCAVACLGNCSGQQAGESEFLSLLPQSGDADRWTPADEPRHVVGEDLFLLINGGAEIYHEYGFEQAAVLSYADDSDRSLNLEIYEMEDPAGAYGIFTFKRGEGCQSLDIGDGSCLQDYYLNLWKGSFLVTVVGFDTEQHTRDGLISLARSTVGKIDEAGEIPRILRLLPPEDLDESSIRYLRGNLALFRTYEFGTGNVFGVTEGVAAKIGEQTVFVFRYPDKSEAARWIDGAVEQLSRSEKFRDVTLRDGTLLATDADDKHLAADNHENYIVLVLGEEAESLAPTMEMLKQRISNQTS